MAEITIRGVRKTYDNKVEAVRGIDLDVADGELLVLVGPSGCGKSTLLRMVAGLEDVTDGAISIGGRDVTYLPPKDRDVAMVFQNYALYPHMTVGKNIAYPLRLAKVPGPERDKRVLEVARLLQLEEVLDRRPAQLSGGQRQRVAMGRALVRQPQAFLMDEPLSNLDAKLRVEMRAEIARLQRDLDVTTLYVTHDQVEAMTMGTRVAVLDRGLLQQVDTPQRIYDAPVNLFVATFIGSPSMNLFVGKVTRPSANGANASNPTDAISAIAGAAASDGGASGEDASGEDASVAIAGGVSREDASSASDGVAGGEDASSAIAGGGASGEDASSAIAGGGASGEDASSGEDRGGASGEDGEGAGRPAAGGEAAADGGADGALVIEFGSQSLTIDGPLLTEHPALADKVGDRVVLGIRPEALDDVGLEPDAPADRVIEATVDLVESLGAELVVHMAVTGVGAADGPTEMVTEAADDALVAKLAEQPAWEAVAARPARTVARLSPRSRLAPGDTVKLAVDPAGVHFFDAETGASLRAGPP